MPKKIAVKLIRTNKYYTVKDVDGKEYAVTILYNEVTDSTSREIKEITAVGGRTIAQSKAEEIFEAVADSNK